MHCAPPGRWTAVSTGPRGDGLGRAGRVGLDGHHASCRTCGHAGDLLGAEELDGRMWVRLTCRHLQQAPRPGEIVLSEEGTRYEKWGTFDYDPADL